MALCLGKRPQEYIRFDNHRGKSPRYHLDEKEVFFKWISLKETEKIFFQMVGKDLAILNLTKKENELKPIALYEKVVISRRPSSQHISPNY